MAAEAGASGASASSALEASAPPFSSESSAAPTALTLCTRVSNVTLPEGRLPCPKCGRRVALYCSTCLVAVCEVLSSPRVKLPLTLDVLRGSEEADSKSTASQALMLASPSRLHRLPSFPVYPDPSRVLLLYPSPSAVAVRDLPDLSRYDTLAVVDTTWVKVGRVFQMPELCAPFTHVKLGSYTTLFWRHQPLGPHCVSSIESIYFFMREWEEEVARRAGTVGGYDGRHDDLLLLFLDQHRRIAGEYAQAGGAKVVSARAAPFLSPAAPQAASLAAAWAGAVGGGEEPREGGGKRRRVKGAWSVAPTVLGTRAGEAAGEAARQEYVAQNMPWIAAAGGGEGAAAAAQFVHIARTNQHAYGAKSDASRESAAAARAESVSLVTATAARAVE